MTVLNAMFMQKRGSENALQYFIHAIPQRDLLKQPNVQVSVYCDTAHGCGVRCAR